MLGHTRSAMVLLLFSWVIALANLEASSAFPMQHPWGPRTRLSPTLQLRAQKNDVPMIQAYLADNFPDFGALVSKNEALWKKIGDSESFTVFAPNAAAFAALGDTRRQQLADPRNLEASEKVGLYHGVAELVTADDLFDSGGVITLGGTIPVERSKSGGLFGVGGTEDGGVTVGGSLVVRSIPVGTGIVHETTGLVSPAILWRYVDQLRIPGSK